MLRTFFHKLYIFSIKFKTKIFQIRKQFYSWVDYMIYRKNLSSFKIFVKNLSKSDKGSLLIVSGRGMNIVWAETWAVLSLAVRIHGYKGVVLTTRAQDHLNRYFKLLDVELIYLDDLNEMVSSDMPDDVKKKVEKTKRFDDVKNLYYKDSPVGQIALSTYSRYHGTGIIDLDDHEALNEVKEWLKIIIKSIHTAEMIYDKHNVKYLFFTEVFMEEYGAFYYTALRKNLNITRFAGTVRDDAYILQHLTKSNDRIHHASLSASSWEKIKNIPYTDEMEKELNQNFIDRYGNKWHRSKRNHPQARIMSIEEARELLGIVPGRKTAVIYSHILYDTLFFFGTDLFDDYAEWLVESVRVACQNDKLDWFIKVHPSNIWRGELEPLLRGRYEEERLISGKIGELPPHVRIIRADSQINPYTWFQMADYGITVRGTSGLEMAALGKTVITGGTGRYEGNGFTIDPDSKEKYLEILSKIPDIPPLSSEQIELAKRYAHAIFILKPYRITSLKPELRTGKKKVVASDDIRYTPSKFEGETLPHDLEVISRWITNESDLDLLARMQSN